MNWLVASGAALVSFGFWGFFTKLAVLHIDSKSALVYQTVGVLAVGFCALWMVNFKPATELKGSTYAILTGAAYGIGCLFYLVAASKGKIITVVTLTALYPLVTIVLAYLLLQEHVSAKQCLGIVCGFIAILLMST